ncbi:unnamed protein product [Lactuca virosa]|uniref:Uncharacterized protein n=1 Tax=Lactuca virosa TaxID=75947 RepID=A0AAU9NUQ5_9ASTR|nr:unnamed protein product [Lactuca virosa]
MKHMEINNNLMNLYKNKRILVIVMIISRILIQLQQIESIQMTIERLINTFIYMLPLVFFLANIFRKRLWRTGEMQII